VSATCVFHPTISYRQHSGQKGGLKDNWLKGFEQNAARRPPDDPMRDYDFGWMWERLGISDLRS
jgi:hypothetical protein